MRRLETLLLVTLLVHPACRKATVRYPTQLSFVQAYDLVFERGSFPPLAKKPAKAIFMTNGAKGVQVFQATYATHFIVQGADGLARYEWTGKADKNTGVFVYRDFAANQQIADLSVPK